MLRALTDKLVVARPVPRAMGNLARKLARLSKACLAGSESPATRGQALLRDWLSPQQLAQFEATGTFDVVGCHSGRRYRIHQGTSMNVTEIDETGAVLIGWCFLPSGNLVAGDVMLAQKIALEKDERAALSVARRFLVNVPR